MEPQDYVQYPRYRQADISVSLIGDAWNFVKSNPGVYIGFTAIMMTASIAIAFAIQGPDIFTPNLGDPYAMYRHPSYWIGQGIQLLFSTCIMGGLVRVAVKEVRGERASLGDAFGILSDGYISVLAAWFLVTILTFAGVALCIFPGIALGALFLATLPALLDQELSPFGAMAWSVQNTKNYFWPILGLCLLGGLLVVLGACACYVGSFVAIPVYSVLTVLIYAQLRAEEAGILGPAPSPINYPGMPTPAEMGDASNGLDSEEELPRKDPPMN